MKVAFHPRASSNPYQDLLVSALADQGVEVTYLPGPGRSHTLLLLAFPWQLLCARIASVRILHIHWTYFFAPAWVYEHPRGRRIMGLWFKTMIRWARLIGIRVVWTAHNVTPHFQVFHDDRAMRRWLISKCDAIVAHGVGTLAPLAELGAHDVVVIPVGAYTSHYPDDLDRPSARRILDIGDEVFLITAVGGIAPYKGIDLLLEAVVAMTSDTDVQVVVAGNCADVELADRLKALAAQAPDRILIRFGFVPDDEIQIYLRAADIGAFPFRAITNSGSVTLALTFGLPVVIPNLPELADIPEEVAIRYEPGGDGLADALRSASSMEAAELASMRIAATEFADSLTWEATARATADVYRTVVNQH